MSSQADYSPVDQLQQLVASQAKLPSPYEDGDSPVTRAVLMAELARVSQRTQKVGRAEKGDYYRHQEYYHRVLLVVLSEMAAVLLLTWLLHEIRLLGDFPIEHPWASAVLLSVALLVQLLLLKCGFRRLSHGYQIVAIALSVVITSLALVLTLTLFETMVLVQTLAFSWLVLLPVFFFTLQSRATYNPLWGFLYMVLIVTLIIVVFIVYPDANFFQHPRVTWIIDTPDTVVRHVLFGILTIASVTYILLTIETAKDEAYVDDYLLVGHSLFVHWFFAMMYAIECMMCCPCRCKERTLASAAPGMHI